MVLYVSEADAMVDYRRILLTGGASLFGSSLALTLKWYCPEATVVCHDNLCQCSHKHVHQAQETCPWGLVEETDYHCMVAHRPQPSIIEVLYVLYPHPFDVVAVD